MQQTLLSLLALLIVTLLSFSQQQAGIQSQQQTVRAELEQMALGVAMQTMEVVRARDFDAGMDLYSQSDILEKPNNNLTDVDYFGREYIGCEDEEDGGCEEDDKYDMPKVTKDCKFHPEHLDDEDKVDCLFVEEFHDTKGTVPFYLGENADGDERVFQFVVEIEVQYVDDDFGPTGDKTLQKKVDIFVQDEPSEGSPRLPDSIKYSEVLSYP